MAQYYIAVIILNTLISALFYFVFRKWGLSSRSFFLTAGISVLTGLVFPLLVGYFNIYVILIIGLITVGTGAFYIVKFSEPVSENIFEIQEDSSVPEEDVIVETQELKESLADLNTDLPNDINDLTVNEDLNYKSRKKKGKNRKKQRNRKKNKIDFKEDIPEENEVSVQSERIEDNSELRESYITRGFDAKEAGKLDLAIKYFISAMELEPPVDLAEMLQFDVYTMLRETGNYIKAIESMEYFLKSYESVLPASNITEIKNQIKYTEILQELLEKANTPNLPFSKIPALIKISLDEKYSKWKSESFNNI